MSDSLRPHKLKHSRLLCPWSSPGKNTGVRGQSLLRSCHSSFSEHVVAAVQSLSRVQLFGTPWTAASQTCLLITNSWSLLKLMSIESVMPSNHLILCCPLLLLPSVFLSIRVFLMSRLFASGGQSIGASASTSVLPMNVQD